MVTTSCMNYCPLLHVSQAVHVFLNEKNRSTLLKNVQVIQSLPSLDNLLMYIHIILCLCCGVKISVEMHLLNDTHASFMRQGDTNASILVEMCYLNSSQIDTVDR